MQAEVEAQIYPLRRRIEEMHYDPQSVDNYAFYSKTQYHELTALLEKLMQRRLQAVRKANNCIRHMNGLYTTRDRYETISLACRDYLLTHSHSRVYQTIMPGDRGLCTSPLEEGGEDMQREAWNHYVDTFLGQTPPGQEKFRSDCRAHQLGRIKFFQARQQLETWLLELTVEAERA